ncbi:MAG TPA: CPBP family intramembrane glutamic endopeptidase [Vicinamibacterales bacterium]|nr:CPBP family intramembrane glutamic endopeptidase [Vicinamibacterales bacterium]
MAWSSERRAAVILASIAVAEGLWVVGNLQAAGYAQFARFLGFRDVHATMAGWTAAIITFLAFTGYALTQFRSVRENALAWSFLKVLGIVVAVTAALCEEGLFRKALMDRLATDQYGVALQIAASAFVFGALHGVWGLFRGSIVAAIGATVATGVLGLALAIVYVISHRVLAPCVVAHFLINLVVEPGLMLAAVRGEMSRG